MLSVWRSCQLGFLLAMFLLACLGCQSTNCPDGVCPSKEKALQSVLTVEDQDGKAFCFVNAADGKLVLVSMAHPREKRSPSRPKVIPGQPNGVKPAGSVLIQSPPPNR